MHPQVYKTHARMLDNCTAPLLILPAAQFVQVHNSMCPQVYETHARIAIEVSDWAEFRQCHSVLQQLYGEPAGRGGPVASYVGGWPEFSQCHSVLQQLYGEPAGSCVHTWARLLGQGCRDVQGNGVAAVPSCAAAAVL